MKRFLIFIGLFPGIVIAMLIAMIAPGDASVVLQLTGWGYAVGIVPALICALADLLLRKTRIPPVIGTALAGYAMAALVFLVISDTTDIGMALSFGVMPLAAVLMPIESATVALTLTFGLLGGISAAVCSWLAGRSGSLDLMPARIGEAR
jgi:hypothetical protein